MIDLRGFEAVSHITPIVEWPYGWRHRLRGRQHFESRARLPHLGPRTWRDQVEHPCTSKLQTAALEAEGDFPWSQSFQRSSYLLRGFH